MEAAVEYARLKGYQGVVLDEPGQPQSQVSPQAKAALKMFWEDEWVTAFYGFSGGGYNVRHILEYLVSHAPGSLMRIGLIVVLGAPLQPKLNYAASTYKARAKGHIPDWELVYMTNPPKSALPSGLPKNTDPHMFGPDVLLMETFGSR